MADLNITAVLVTRGDVDLEPILATFPSCIDDVVVWDNSREQTDEMTWGRCWAIERARNRVIYSQDDDLLHTPEAIERIIAARKPGGITACMWPEWSAGAREQGIHRGYDDVAFMGSGSCFDRETPLIADARYLERFPLDDFFRLWADTIIGVLAFGHHVDERFEILPCATDENRMSNLPDGVTRKRSAIERARAVRDRQLPELSWHYDHHELVLERTARDLDRLGVVRSL